MRRVKHTLYLLLLGVMIAAGISPALAVGQTPAAEATPDAGPRFVLRPVDGQDGGYFTVNAAPGSTTDLIAVLGNAGSEPIDLHTYASDAVVLVNGGFGAREENDERTGPATWIDWNSETYTFEPGQGIERRFTVTVPEDVAPGEYIAAISLQTAEPIEIPGSTIFNQIIRKSIAVFIIV